MKASVLKKIEYCRSRAFSRIEDLKMKASALNKIEFKDFSAEPMLIVKYLSIQLSLKI